MTSSRTSSEQVCSCVLDQVPREFGSFLTEPAFSVEETTFCIWRKNEDAAWQTGEIKYPEEEDPDGSEDLLFILDGNPETYREFAEQYYERVIATDVVLSLIHISEPTRQAEISYA